MIGILEKSQIQNLILFKFSLQAGSWEYFGLPDLPASGLRLETIFRHQSETKSSEWQIKYPWQRN